MKGKRLLLVFVSFFVESYPTEARDRAPEAGRGGRARPFA